jgi:hypothetical protein
MTITGDRLYRRTQVSWPTIVPLVLTAALVSWTLLRVQFGVGLGIALGILAVVCLLFATLTVTVTSDGLLASFGIGLIGKRIAFTDVESFSRVRNRWTNGWGIHPYPGGTLYNASGLSAVEFKLSSGRYVSVGTAEPDALVAAVRQATGKSEAPREPLAGRPRWGTQQTVGAVIGAIALAIVAASFYFGFQPPAVSLADDALSVSNGLYRNTIRYSTIRSARLDFSIPRIGVKTNGFAAGDTLRGNFNVDRWGNARLYINRNSPPFVVIETDGHVVAVNFKDAVRTRALYEDLTSHLNRSGK